MRDWADERARDLIAWARREATARQRSAAMDDEATWSDWHKHVLVEGIAAALRDCFAPPSRWAVRFERYGIETFCLILGILLGHFL